MRKNSIIYSIILLCCLFITIAPVYALGNKNKDELIQNEHIGYINLDWWEEFEDEYLKGYILKAIVNNHDAKIATLKVEEARQKVKMQLSQEFPTAMVGASPTLTKFSGVTNTTGIFSMPMIVSYEFDIFLKNHDKTKSVKKIYEASKLSEEATYISIASAVGSTYYNIVKADELIRLQEKIVTLRREIYNLKQKSYNQGLVSMTDLIIAEKAYINSEVGLSDLQKGRSSLLTAFAVLLGDSPSEINSYKRISYSELKNKKIIPDKISSDVIMMRPDYQIAEKMLEKAGIDVRIAKKEFLPTFNILGFMAFLTDSDGAKFNYQNALGAAAISTLYPVFTGGRRIANFKLNKNQYLQAMENYQNTNLAAVKEVDDALSNLKYDYEKYQKTQKNYEIEIKDYKLCQSRYNHGLISNLELKEKEEVLLDTQRLLVVNNMDNRINHISLYKSTAAGK